MANPVEIVHKAQKVQMTKEQLVRFQVHFLCHHIKGLKLSTADMECLTLLGLIGAPKLSVFCNKVRDVGIFKSVQSTRNALGRMEEMGLVVKQGARGTTTVALTAEMDIVTRGNILLDIKCYSPDNVS